MGMKDRLILFAATGFGLGKLPVAPGTFGTLAGLPLIAVMVWLGTLEIPGATAFFVAGFILVSIWVADCAEKIMGCKDPGAIVIDEMAGYLVVMTLVPVTGITLLAGFAAFRLFDVVKPQPVRYFEKNFSGGAGVVLDDIMAGLLAAVLLKVVCLTGIL